MAEPVLCEGQRINIIGFIVDGIFYKFDRGADRKCCNIIHQLFPFVADYDNDAGEVKGFYLMEHAVNQGDSIDFYHAFRVVLC